MLPRESRQVKIINTSALMEEQERQGNKKVSQNTSCHSQRSEESLISASQPLRLVQSLP
jgi:hypothetical protein